MLQNLGLLLLIQNSYLCKALRYINDEKFKKNDSGRVKINTCSSIIS